MRRFIKIGFKLEGCQYFCPPRGPYKFHPATERAQWTRTYYMHCRPSKPLGKISVYGRGCFIMYAQYYQS